MIPTLKKISSAKSASEIAELLQKHIGDGTNQKHCEAACDAVRRIRNEDIRTFLQRQKVLLNVEGAEVNWCEFARFIISLLHTYKREG
jgi:hypothetical protein